MNILIVGFKYNHHGSFSGYDCIVPFLKLSEDLQIDYLNIYKFLIFQNSSNFLKNLLHRLNHRFLLLIYNIFINFLLIKNRYNIIHFIYPEDTMTKMNLTTTKKTKIISTLHQPVNWFLNLEKNRYLQLKKNSFFICLGSNQMKFINNFFKTENSSLIRHGINPKKFRLLNKKRSNNEILVVGGWLRDLDLLEQIVNYFDKTHNYKFNLVLGRLNTDRFKKYNNVLIHINISDNELNELYNNTSLVLFVLKDCVANNALLESLVNGNCIISSDVGGVKDYGRKNSIKLVNHDLKSFTSAIEELMVDRTKRKYFSSNALKESKNLAWNKISTDTINLYKKLLKI